jgi:uncharacterized protein YbgA (DUF1722 family)
VADEATFTTFSIENFDSIEKDSEKMEAVIRTITKQQEQINTLMKMIGILSDNQPPKVRLAR